MIEIPRAQSSEKWMQQPGPLWHPARLDGKHTAMVTCDSGHAAYLSDHTIADDGTVSPSLVCPEKDCPWHVMAKLAGWKP